MTIEWNKVTWYSKIAAVIVFGGVFALGYWIGLQNTTIVYVDVGGGAHRDGLSSQTLDRLDKEPDAKVSPDTIVLSNGKILSSYLQEKGMATTSLSAASLSFQKDILNQLSKVDPTLHWSAEISTKEGLPGNEFSGIEIRATSTKSRAGKDHDWTFLYNTKLGEQGFSEDTSLASDGPMGGMTGFRKQNFRVILIEHIKYNGIDTPEGEAVCPCDFMYKIFVGDYQ